MTTSFAHLATDHAIIPDDPSPATVRPVWNTPEAIDIMKALWAEGRSATEIGARLGVTKNAILGKIHRLGLHRHAPKLPREPGPSRPSRREKRPAAVKSSNARANAAQVRPAAPARDATTVPAGARTEMAAPLFRVRPLGCRWPLWADDAKPDHTYCGKPAVAAWPGVYCTECRAKAFAKTASPPDMISKALPNRGGDRSTA